MYKIPVAKHHVYFGAGAYGAYGISGKLKMTVKMDGEDVEGGTMQEDPFKKGQGDEGLKRTDFGVNAMAGIQFSNGIFANLGYQMGLSNNSRDVEGEFKNRGAQLTIGYFFWKK